MNQETKVQVQIPNGEILIGEFTYEAMEYIMNRYDGMDEAYESINALGSGISGINKKNMACFIDFVVAMFITNHPEVTPEIIKKKIPYNQLAAFAKIIPIIIKAGQAEVGANFRVIPWEETKK